MALLMNNNLFSQAKNLDDYLRASGWDSRGYLSRCSTKPECFLQHCSGVTYFVGKMAESSAYPDLFKADRPICAEDMIGAQLEDRERVVEPSKLLYFVPVPKNFNRVMDFHWRILTDRELRAITVFRGMSVPEMIQSGYIVHGEGMDVQRGAETLQGMVSRFLLYLEQRIAASQLTFGLCGVGTYLSRDLNDGVDWIDFRVVLLNFFGATG